MISKTNELILHDGICQGICNMRSLYNIYMADVDDIVIVDHVIHA